MLNLLIFLTVTLLFILIAIKYGFLQIAAIILAIIALIPFTMSIVLYFLKTPKIAYSIDHKEKIKKGDIYFYDIYFGFRSDRGRGLLNNVFISPQEMVFASKHPMYSGNFELFGLTEEGGFSPTMRIDFKDTPLFVGRVFSFPIRFHTVADKKKIIARFSIDIKVDAFKLGPLSIFKPYYNYRYFLEVPIDFENLDIQKGYIKPRY